MPKNSTSMVSLWLVVMTLIRTHACSPSTSPASKPSVKLLAAPRPLMVIWKTSTSRSASDLTLPPKCIPKPLEICALTSYLPKSTTTLFVWWAAQHPTLPLSALLELVSIASWSVKKSRPRTWHCPRSLPRSPTSSVRELRWERTMVSFLCLKDLSNSFQRWRS